MKLLKKITAKDVMGPVVEVAKNMSVDETKPIYAVAGIAKGYETGMSTFGEWVRFSGDFQAINYVSGETMRAEKVHVPDVLESALLAGIEGLEGVTQSTPGGNITKYRLENPIEFAYEVSLKRNKDDDNGAISYEYITTPKTEVAPNDAIAHLTRLLDAPKTDTKPAKKAAEK